MSSEPCSQHHVVSNQVAILVTRFDEAEKSRAEFRTRLEAEIIELKSLVKATNGRVRNLETWRTFLTGAFVALSMPAAAKLVNLLSR